MSQPTVTMRGNPLALEGTLPEPGSPAPDVELLDNDLQPVRLSDYRGKVCVISAVPSLDTPVCDMETRRFNAEAALSTPAGRSLAPTLPATDRRPFVNASAPS